MDQQRILEQRDEIEEMLKASELMHYDGVEELDERFDEAAQTVERIMVGDISEWVGQFYRQWYRDWQDGERDEPPCRCSNPRCPFKRGELPYPLRQRRSSIREGQNGREALVSYLDSHPEALVVDRALDRQEEMASEVGREFRKLHRDIEAAVMEAVDGDEARAKQAY